MQAIGNANIINTLTHLRFKRLDAMFGSIGTVAVRAAARRGISLLSPRLKHFEIVDNEFFVDKVMNSRVPVIVNFHAEWCDPCKILTPKLQQLVGPMEELDLATINVEDNPELVHTFQVKAVPAVIAVANGVVVDKFIGLVDADMIDKLISKLVKSDSKT